MRETVSERVIQEVANFTNTNALQLPPLYGAIDPDALDALIEGMSNGEVSFPYGGNEVTVESDGTINLDKQPLGDTAAEMAVCDDQQKCGRR